MATGGGYLLESATDADVRLGDCREIMPSLPDASVDAIISDPPVSGDVRLPNHPEVESSASGKSRLSFVSGDVVTLDEGQIIGTIEAWVGMPERTVSLNERVRRLDEKVEEVAACSVLLDVFQPFSIKDRGDLGLQAVESLPGATRGDLVACQDGVAFASAGVAKLTLVRRTDLGDSGGRVTFASGRILLTEEMRRPAAKRDTESQEVVADPTGADPMVTSDFGEGLTCPVLGGKHFAEIDRLPRVLALPRAISGRDTPFFNEVSMVRRTAEECLSALVADQRYRPLSWSH